MSSGTITDRHVFYNQSVWDGNSAAIDPVMDNAAIATDKDAYLPNATIANFNHITSYSRGINGIMVDISPVLGNHAAITASDFTFKVGNNNTPGSWAAAHAPSGFSVVLGGGVSGSDRVIITWASGAIRNTWLEVQVKANANTGLVAPDVHFWGSKVADSGTGTPAGTFATNSADTLQVYSSLGGNKSITDLRDYNRDGAVSSNDSLQVFANLGSIVRINIGPSGPFGPGADPAVDDSGLAVALALRSRSLEVAGALSTTDAMVSTSVESLGRTFPTPQAASSANWQGAKFVAVDGVFDDGLADVDDDLLELFARRRMR